MSEQSIMAQSTTMIPKWLEIALTEWKNEDPSTRLPLKQFVTVTARENGVTSSHIYVLIDNARQWLTIPNPYYTEEELATENKKLPKWFRPAFLRWMSNNAVAPIDQLVSETFTICFPLRDQQPAYLKSIARTAQTMYLESVASQKEDEKLREMTRHIEIFRDTLNLMAGELSKLLLEKIEKRSMDIVMNGDEDAASKKRRSVLATPRLKKTKFTPKISSPNTPPLLINTSPALVPSVTNATTTPSRTVIDMTREVKPEAGGQVEQVRSVEDVKRLIKEAAAARISKTTKPPKAVEQPKEQMVEPPKEQPKEPVAPVATIVTTAAVVEPSKTTEINEQSKLIGDTEKKQPTEINVTETLTEVLTEVLSGTKSPTALTDALTLVSQTTQASQLEVSNTDEWTARFLENMATVEAKMASDRLLRAARPKPKAKRRLVRFDERSSSSPSSSPLSSTGKQNGKQEWIGYSGPFLRYRRRKVHARNNCAGCSVATEGSEPEPIAIVPTAENTKIACKFCFNL